MTTITVTAQHIARGERYSWVCCPVALAIRDALPDVGVVMVRHECLILGDILHLVTLDLPDGVKETVQCGPEVANFDQIRAGDQLKVTATDEVKVFMAPTTMPTESGAATIARAPLGAKPSAVVSGSWQTTATVTAIDMPNRRASLQFEDGSAANVRVRDDVALSQRDVGRKVAIRITETVAIAVGKAS